MTLFDRNTEIPKHRITVAPSVLLALKTRLLAASPAFIRLGWERLEASPIGYRLAKGAFWSLIGAVLSRGLGLLATMLVARMLGKRGFGEFGVIQSTVGMFGTVALFGLGVTATKFVAEFRDSAPERAGRVLALSALMSWVTGTAVALILLGSARWLATNSLAAPHLTTELRIASLLLLLEAVNGAQTGALAGFEAYRRIAQINLVTGLAGFLLLPGGCCWLGLPGAVGGLAATQVLGCALNRWGLVQEARHHHVPLWSYSWKFEMPLLWRFSLPAVMAALLVSPTLWLCQTMLARQTSGYQDLAEYAVGGQWRSLVTYFPGLLCTAYLPVFSSLNEIADLSRRRRLLIAGLCFAGGTTLLTALPVFIATPWILSAYGPEFISAKWILAIMLLAGVADGVNGILVRTLMAINRAWARLISNAAWAVIQLSTAVVLVPSYGAYGLAISVCAAQFLHLAIQIPLTIFLCNRRL